MEKFFQTILGNSILVYMSRSAFYIQKADVDELDVEDGIDVTDVNNVWTVFHIPCDCECTGKTIIDSKHILFDLSADQFLAQVTVEVAPQERPALYLTQLG